MTPTRSKRNSKVPERFSSDVSRIDISSAEGETIIDYNDKTTSTTHKLAPIDAKIKLKPVQREPLKVKLPKLKRLQSMQSRTKDQKSTKAESNEIRVHKIKLPPRKPRQNSEINSGTNNNNNKVKDTQRPKQKSTSKIHSEIRSVAEPLGLVSKGMGAQSKHTNIKNDHQMETYDKSIISSKLESFSSGCSHEPTHAANTSIDSEITNSSGMQIVVAKSNNNNESGIKCPCGVDDDLGVMVECEKCSTWQHGHCINVGPEEDAYEGYICAFCTLPMDKAQTSLHQLTVGDKLQSRFKELEFRNENDSCSPASGRQARILLTADELARAVQDLRRVTNSLNVKWKVLTGRDQESELKIWKNPIWSADPRENLQQGPHQFFLDYYRSNLKLNIRNMLSEVGKRCKLMMGQILLVESQGNENPHEKLEKVKQQIVDFNKLVEWYQEKLKILPNSLV